MIFQEPEAGSFRDWFTALPFYARVAGVLLIVLVGHWVARLVRIIGEWVASPDRSPTVARRLIEGRGTKIVTVSSLVVSALTFTIYFVAVGFAIGELTPLTLTQYFASATIIGLAVGFGTQGLVQDVVTGLTLIFSNAIDIGDLAEVSGQVGRVEKIGLRFTTLTNFVGQTVVIPNRNIGAIGRFRNGYARAYLDVQIPEGVEDDVVTSAIDRIGRAARKQHDSVIIGDPRVHAVQQAGDDGWRFIRVRFRIWPGQQGIIEGAVRQRVIAAMKELDPSFADWMVTVTYRIVDQPALRTAAPVKAGRRGIGRSGA